MTTTQKTKITAESGQQQIVITRIFDAPRELVFSTYLDPELIPHWWGPRELSTTVDKMDPRTGGSWRILNHDKDGTEYGFHGVYHDITPSERIVHTFEFEGMPGHVLLETLTFEDVDGKTKLTDHSVFQTLEDRDGMIASGMESGAADTLERLAEVLAAK